MMITADLGAGTKTTTTTRMTRYRIPRLVDITFIRTLASPDTLQCFVFYVETQATHRETVACPRTILFTKTTITIGFVPMVDNSASTGMEIQPPAKGSVRDVTVYMPVHSVGNLATTLVSADLLVYKKFKQHASTLFLPTFSWRFLSHCLSSALSLLTMMLQLSPLPLQIMVQLLPILFLG